jgi:signal transduction histidine kinase
MGVYGEINEAQREALVRVSRSQRHLLSLITDVLNLVRIETGHVEYKLTSIPVEPLVADVLSLVEPLLMANHLEYSAATSPSATTGAPLAINADREKVHQILLNLLTNAIKFTAPQGRITIDAEESTDNSNTVCIRLSDTGIGIPPEKLETIFEPFVQLRGDSGSREGLGLGLAISRDLARGMSGDLSATSTFGKGTTFTLKLPRA